MPKRLERPLPAVGAKYHKKFKGKYYILEVVIEKGKIAYSLQGKIFRTPTAAAKSLTNTEVNGWDFWQMD